MKDDDYTRLEEKCRRIEEWSEEELGVEVHFFLTKPSRLAANEFGAVSSESCGSALRKLLKEEYYRGSLLLSGKIPYWWIVPLGCDDERYTQIVDAIERDSDAARYEFVDIGNIDTIPMEELVGGGIWQLNKAMTRHNILLVSLMIQAVG